MLGERAWMESARQLSQLLERASSSPAAFCSDSFAAPVSLLELRLARRSSSVAETSRCCAPSCRLRSILLRCSSPALTIRAREPVRSSRACALATASETSSENAPSRSSASAGSGSCSRRRRHPKEFPRRRSVPIRSTGSRSVISAAMRPSCGRSRRRARARLSVVPARSLVSSVPAAALRPGRLRPRRVRSGRRSSRCRHPGSERPRSFTSSTRAHSSDTARKTLSGLA